ncbi:hypothetical protein BGZ94_004538 [Podila epigama]|nr:hypothetical protein BGZ94_004538 [Podila epigama]
MSSTPITSTSTEKTQEVPNTQQVPNTFTETNPPPAYIALYQADVKQDHTVPPPRLPITTALPTSQQPIEVESLRSKPAVVTCHHCKHLVLTHTKTEAAHNIKVLTDNQHKMP